jgi:hypothetical protein
MTELAMQPAGQPELPPVVTGPVVTVPDTTVVITEQQVLFGTVAAVAPPLPRTGRIGALVHRVAALFDRPVDPPNRPPRHRPTRADYLERSLMGREMRRL